MYHLAADTGDTEHQEDKAQNQLHSNQRLGTLRAHLISVGQEGGNDGNGRGDPPGHHGVAQQHMQVVEEAVNDDHGQGYTVRNAQDLLQHGDSAQAGRTHEHGLHHLGNRPFVVDKGEADLENPGLPVGLFFTVFTVTADKLFVCHLRSLFLIPNRSFVSLAATVGQLFVTLLLLCISHANFKKKAQSTAAQLIGLFPREIPLPVCCISASRDHRLI